jgi:superfamily II DNA or RNA helicase
MTTIDMTIKHSGQVEIEVGYVYSKINGDLPAIVVSKLDGALSYYVPGYAFSKAYREGWWNQQQRKFIKWDGKNHLLKNRMFLSGFVGKVSEIIQSSGMSVEIKDTRKTLVCGPEISVKNIEDREYQQKAVKAAIDSDSGGIIKVATGGGKSLIMAQIAAKMNVKTMIMITGVDLLYQFKEMLGQTFGTKVGIIGDGLAEVRRINICSIWTAAKALDAKIDMDEEDLGRQEKYNDRDKAKIAKAIQTSELILYDECQMLSCETMQAINKAAKAARKKLGFSGTPFRDDGCDLLLEGIVGRNIIDIPASELIAKGFLVKPTIQFVTIPELPDLGTNYQTIYKKYIVENEVRNQRIVELALKLKEHGRKTLILVKNLKHGQTLLDLLEPSMTAYFVRGELDSDERNSIRNDFIKGKIDLIIASSVFDQGIDLCNLDALILAGAGKSPGRALQRIGRVIRPFKGKTDALVVDFLDQAKYLDRHSQKRLQTYQTEDGFEIRLPKEEMNAKQEKKVRVPKKSDGGAMPW